MDKSTELGLEGMRCPESASSIVSITVVPVADLVPLRRSEWEQRQHAFGQGGHITCRVALRTGRPSRTALADQWASRSSVDGIVSHGLGGFVVRWALAGDGLTGRL
ncbi:hypothetical protein PGTUg99_011800 [Puccinia graminis f. sp. tritici]|uniref:Uncharacterized protein n=1 Tax=Puccinia graminis f. sp. tritici TaxID=56615 RepID=A0A5B0RTX1_PUCGR|nr:hypothetical protein PGTUg99_011800 [Puccinia graminis f. sp. tritici]